MRDLSILALAEIRLKGKGDRIISKNYRLMYSGEVDSRHGVGFLVTNNIAPYVEKVKNISERTMSIDMKLETGISMIQVYAPQKGRTTAEKEEFYRLPQEGMDDAKYQSNIMVSESAIGQHLLTNPECAKTYTDDNFRIIGQGRSSFHLSVLESVYIKTQNPVLCKQKDFIFSLGIFK